MRYQFGFWKVALVAASVAVGLAGVPAHAQTPARPLQGLRNQLLGGSQIGVTIRDVEAADVTKDKLPADTGVVVESVESNSPAEKAGIKTGDVIVSFDGEKVKSVRQLTRLITETPDGRQVSATVVRGTSHLDLKVQPAASQEFALNSTAPNLPRQVPPAAPFLNQRPNARANRPAAAVQSDRGRLGVGVSDLTPQLGNYFGASSGALVTTVTDGTPAASAGLKAGDVITKVNGEAVNGSSDLATKIASAGGRTALTVVRDHREQTVTADLGAAADSSGSGSSPRQITK